jgi:hypothetical protein
MKAAARFPELDPHDALPARSGFGTTAGEVFASAPQIGLISRGTRPYSEKPAALAARHRFEAGWLAASIGQNSALGED